MMFILMLLLPACINKTCYQCSPGHKKCCKPLYLGVVEIFIFMLGGTITKKLGSADLDINLNIMIRNVCTFQNCDVIGGQKFTIYILKKLPQHKPNISH